MKTKVIKIMISLMFVGMVVVVVVSGVSIHRIDKDKKDLRASLATKIDILLGSTDYLFSLLFSGVGAT